MNQDSSQLLNSRSTTVAAETDACDDDDDDGQDSDSSGGGGAGGDEIEVGEEAATELTSALTSLAVDTSSAHSGREVTDPRVRIPDERGGGFAYKRTVVEEFNSGIDTRLDASRLTRIKLSSQQINELDVALQNRLEKQKVAMKAGGQVCGGSSKDSGSSGAGAGTPDAKEAAASSSVSSSSSSTASSRTIGNDHGSGEEEEVDLHVSIGSDVAFAMVVGTGSRAVHQWWIGRVVKLFKGKGLWRGAVSIAGELPTDLSAVCEWYSPIPRTDNQKFFFRETCDRTKYEFTHFIGAVRIDIDIDDTSSKDTYSITEDVRASLDEALKMTTPVTRGSEVTVGDKKKKDKKKADEDADNRARMQRPRAEQGKGGGRNGTRGATAAAAEAAAEAEEGGS